MRIQKICTLLSLLICFSAKTEANINDTQCFVRYDISKYFFKKSICDSKGRLISVNEYFLESGKLSNESFYDSLDRVVKKVNYSTEGDFYLKIFEYAAGSKFETLYQKNSTSLIKYKLEVKNEKTIRKWQYKEGILQWVDTFNPRIRQQILEREFPTGTIYKFTYSKSSRYNDEINKFTVFEQGSKVGQYIYKFDGDIESIIMGQFTGETLTKRLAQFRAKDRTTIAVVDSGFDIFHPAITPYLYNHSSEKWGETDWDQNGLVGDIMGWSYDSYKRQSANINEKVIVGSLKPVPLSHGTHVASIALSGHEKAALLGFAGDVSKPDYLNLVSRELKLKKARVANFSWGFKEAGVPFTPPVKTYKALESLITSNSHTLFYVAAGNSGWDLEGSLKDYPASFSYNNLFVIGALEASDYSWSSPEKISPATFKNGLGSNTGFLSVDIFAPGKMVNGAKLGGGMVRMSGTSMASPYAINSSFEAFELLPHFGSLKIKELMMKTAGLSARDLPCVSRGFVHGPRATQVAKYLLKYPSLSIEEAILQGRFYEAKKLLYPGEVLPELSRLRKNWQAIDNSMLLNKR